MFSSRGACELRMFGSSKLPSSFGSTYLHMRPFGYPPKCLRTDVRPSGGKNKPGGLQYLRRAENSPSEGPKITPLEGLRAPLQRNLGVAKHLLRRDGGPQEAKPSLWRRIIPRYKTKNYPSGGVSFLLWNRSSPLEARKLTALEELYWGNEIAECEGYRRTLLSKPQAFET